MRQICLSFILLFSFVSVFSSDYTNIDQQTRLMPANLKTVEEIAGVVTKSLTLPDEKARALYIWISQIIRYDVEQMNTSELYFDAREIIDEVLKTRKGICQHYTELFHACCKLAGVESYIITGYTKLNNEISPLGHAWNAIVIDSKFYNIDVTWAAGYLQNGKYIHKFRDEFFMISPAEFIKSHIPFDPLWQFLNNPLTHKEFETGDFSKLKITGNFHFSDSIQSLSKLTELEKYMRENRRITKAGLTNQLIRKHVAFNQLYIVNEKFNAAITLFNSGVESFNLYVLNKNKQFNNLTMDDEQILELLSTSRKHIEKAENSISFLNSDDKELNRKIRELQQSVEAILKKLQTEDEFMKKYTETWKPFRIFLFYKPK
jgi:hypothetical protein